MNLNYTIVAKSLQKLRKWNVLGQSTLVIITLQSTPSAFLFFVVDISDSMTCTGDVTRPGARLRDKDVL